MSNRSRCLFMLTAVLCMVFTLFCGCEADSELSNPQFWIEPAEIVLGPKDRSLVLEAVGGSDPFTWSASNTNLGSVAGSGRTVTYNGTAENGVNMIKVKDSNAWTASAVIKQQEEEEEAEPLTVDPGSATLAHDGDKVNFTGLGGTGPYTWSVGDAARGHLSVSGWSQAVYTRDGSGNNSVVVNDANGHSAVAQVEQPAAGSDLTVTGNPGSLANDGDRAVLTASGGIPPYSWEVEDDSLGGLSLSSGNSVVYTRNHAGANVVVTRDSTGRVVHTLIQQP